MATTPSTTEVRSGTVRVNGVRLFNEDLGQGPAILVGENDRGSGLAATVPAWAMGEARPGRHDPRWQVAGGARQQNTRPHRPMPCWST
jgi:hypothetical protein